MLLLHGCLKELRARLRGLAGAAPAPCLGSCRRFVPPQPHDVRAKCLRNRAWRACVSDRCSPKAIGKYPHRHGQMHGARPSLHRRMTRCKTPSGQTDTQTTHQAHQGRPPLPCARVVGGSDRPTVPPTRRPATSCSQGIPSTPLPSTSGNVTPSDGP